MCNILHMKTHLYTVRHFHFGLQFWAWLKGLKVKWFKLTIYKNIVNHLLCATGYPGGGTPFISL